MNAYELVKALYDDKAPVNFEISCPEPELSVLYVLYVYSKEAQELEDYAQFTHIAFQGYNETIVRYYDTLKDVLKAKRIEIAQKFPTYEEAVAAPVVLKKLKNNAKRDVD